MIHDFLAYERSLSTSLLFPLLESLKLGLTGKSVLDVGCGYGGVLSVLHEKYDLSNALGIDLDPEMIDQGKMRSPPGVKMQVEDFFKLDGAKYDFILMRDVLEHIVNVEKALSQAHALLKPGGAIYVTFAPFYSPFGGHQHNAAGFFSNIPWLQFLPEAIFRKFLRQPGNSYKSSIGLEADLESVLRTRLTIKSFRALLPKTGFEFKYYVQYLIRPDYRIKFSLPTVGFPQILLIEEIFCTGVEAVLVKI